MFVVHNKNSKYNKDFSHPNVIRDDGSPEATYKIKQELTKILYKVSQKDVGGFIPTSTFIKKLKGGFGK